MLERSCGKQHTEVTFVIPADQPDGQVSVVGDFNDWQPGTHTFAARKDGTRAVAVTLPGEQQYEFRYLAAGDYWFDEDQADGHDGRNGILRT
ncbi:hypothetical protein SLUN_02300 [Streptomyces lunaelactis]|uniref:Glycoside hydrolase family 13 n=1 Tax=Streptomyces lunaelactis TaxID=1535768 RepID=A0A2R4SWJ1_9ACTN|nr:isoamylase early set domain-containing protein [Streptomyces lunaelactis]AVZ71239.1 hypothetical protein SLUN_02300 [Streptomyces lunaelactis]NUK23138.1 isoamylase early set domain-containing protein [Streptomyces lunaelactis]NUK35587.1 isoamylase early set domain-containing protein [Streptomyces lunaelactis]NUK40609.1 isoamylase early set domain-containing protein [Streptomyces lunaelactis]NUK53806.1 isoamylase early set domain-containing protein [Streptomyces lunaelactis]